MRDIYECPMRNIQRLLATQHKTDIKGRLIIRPIFFCPEPPPLHQSKPLHIFFTLSGGCATADDPEGRIVQFPTSRKKNPHELGCNVWSECRVNKCRFHTSLDELKRNGSGDILLHCDRPSEQLQDNRGSPMSEGSLLNQQNDPDDQRHKCKSDKFLQTRRSRNILFSNAPLLEFHTPVHGI